MMLNSLSFNTFSVAEAAPEQVIELALEAGASAIGLFATHAEQLSAQVLREVSVTGVYVTFLEDKTASITNVANACAHAFERFGAPLVVIPTSDGALDVTRLAEILCNVLDSNSRGGLRLEPLHPSLGNVSNLLSLQDALLVREQVARKRPELSSRVRLVLDLIHVSTDEIFALNQTEVANIDVVHIADSTQAFNVRNPDVRLPPGDGDLPLKEILSDLIEKGFAGWWELETVQPFASMEQIISRNLVAGKKLLTSART